ncbi:MAG TPA: hypothetical protein VLH56_17010 [Dissulfurispiraceae bacterium]|nr:hypothetical protein [Dissulfurispiraceae bacterium]
MRAWLGALTEPFVAIRHELLQWRIESNRDINMTGQRIYLERLLNDLFDPALRRIRVRIGAFISIRYVFNRIESQTAFFKHNKSENNPVMAFAHNQAELIVQIIDFDFMVYVPFAPEQSPVETTLLRRKVEQYRIATKKFDIKRL